MHYPITIHNQSQIKIFSIINQKKNMSYPSIVRGVIYNVPTLQPALWILTHRGRGTWSSWRFIQVLKGQHVFLRYIYNQAEFACQALVVDHVAGFRFYCFWDGVLPKKKLKQGTNTYKMCHFAILYKFTVIFSIHPRQPSQHIRPSKATTHIYIYIYIHYMYPWHPSIRLRGIHVSAHPSPRSKNFMNFRPKKTAKNVH